MRKTVRPSVCAALALVTALVVGAGLRAEAATADAIAQLQAERPGVEISVDPATGAARFIRFPAEGSSGLRGTATIGDTRTRALDFLTRHGAAFGLRNAGEELNLVRVLTDRQGWSHLNYSQFHDGVPVFGTSLKVHFDASGALRVVNGTVLSNIQVSPLRRRDAREAGDMAVQFVGADGASVLGSRLIIFREGLAKGAPGADHLAWEIEVGNGSDIREFVYVDAHTRQGHRPDHRDPRLASTAGPTTPRDLPLRDRTTPPARSGSRVSCPSRPAPSKPTT